MAAALAACESTPKDEFANISPDKLYADAKDDGSEGNYETAIKKLEKVEARASGTLLAQQAQIDLAYAYYKTGERAQALAKLERFIRLHPTSPALDYAYYLQGLVNFNDNLGLFGRLASQDISERDQQASRDAYESFRTLIDRFPTSKYAPDARLRMNHIVNSMAAGECTLRGTTSAVAPTWLPQTALRPQCASTAPPRQWKKRCPSWRAATMRLAWCSCATTPCGCCVRTSPRVSTCRRKRPPGRRPGPGGSSGEVSRPGSLRPGATKNGPSRPVFHEATADTTQPPASTPPVAKPLNTP